MTGGDAVEEPVDLLGGHHLGQFLRGLGRADQARDVERDHAFAEHEAEQAADGGEFAAQGDGGELVAVERGEPLAEE